MPRPTWDDVNVSVPLNDGPRYVIVAMNPHRTPWGTWGVLIVVPVFSIMSGIEIEEATDERDACKKALVFAHSDYDNLIAKAAKKRQHLMRN